MKERFVQSMRMLNTQASEPITAASVGPVPARLDLVMVYRGRAGDKLTGTLTLHLEAIPPEQRETLTRMLQVGKELMMTLATPTPPSRKGSCPEDRRQETPSESLPAASATPNESSPDGERPTKAQPFVNWLLGGPKSEKLGA